MAAPQMPGREDEIRALLATVSDPELDEPVTELGFVTAIRVSAEGDVEIGFRLPTYWCAANFAFMMAEDMRAAAFGAAWVRGVRVVLDEHMYAEAVNRGMAEGLSFREAFGAEANDDLAEVRRTFTMKAFQRRQLALIEHLRAAGVDAESILGLDLASLRRMPLDAGGDLLRARYLEKRAIAGAAGLADPAFVDGKGEPIAVDGLAAHLRACRRVAVNGEFNGALCRGLLAARYGEDSCRAAGMSEPAPGGVMDSSREPSFVDFLRAAVHERAAAVPQR